MGEIIAYYNTSKVNPHKETIWDIIIPGIYLE